MSLKIIELRAENFKRLKAVEIKPDGSLVIIHGKNAAGKSSVLDAIWAAVGGKKAVPPKPIREGEDNCEIHLDLGDYIVTRVFTENHTYLTVKNADGAKISNPQALLDSMIASIAFDPLEFSRMSPKEQAANLALVAKVDFDELNEQKAAAYDTRTDVNREVKRLTSVVAEMKASDSDIASKEPLEEVPVDELILELECARNQHLGFHTDKRKLEELKKSLIEKSKELVIAKDLVSRLEREIIEGQEIWDTIQEDLNGREKKLADMQAIQQKISEADSIKEHNRAVKDYKHTRHEHYKKCREADSLTDQIQEIDKKKTELVAAADLPVSDLTFDESGVFYHGVPFEQCSGSEQLKVSTAIAVGFNPKLRVIRINDGSLLDKENLAVLEEIAKAQDFQIWIERVDEGADGAGILIEDGQVVK